MLVVSLRGELDQIKKKIDEIQNQADALEFRLDLMTFKNFKELLTLRQSISLPLILTVKARNALPKKTWSDYLSLEPTYIDFDALYLARYPHLASAIPIISSYHDFKKTPDDLFSILSQMQKTPAAIYKIATYAQSSLDALRMLIFVDQMRKKGVCLAGMCMGAKGVITRILAPVVDSLLTYASYSFLGQTAPGQLPISQLKEIYHFYTLDSKTLIYALIGDPIDQSLGHIYHNKKFTLLKHHAIYIKVPLQPQELPLFFSLIDLLPFQGMSVTMPLKDKVIPYLHAIDPKLQAICAVNTLAKTKEGWRGWNTDALGALDAIEMKRKVRGKRVLIVGGGATARALAFETHARGGKVIIANRSYQKAKHLAKQVKGKGYALTKLSSLCQRGYDILMHATPVGMIPHSDHSLFHKDWLLKKSLVFDVIYNPKKTLLLRDAKDRGCVVVYGDAMYKRQAAWQTKIWVNKAFDIR